MTDCASRAFLDHLRFNRNVSAHTVRAYESDITQYLPWSRPNAAGASAISRPTISRRDSARSHLAELGRRGDARSSMARKLSALRTFLRYLRREGVLDARSDGAGRRAARANRRCPRT